MTTPRISRWTADEAQLALAADLYADAFAEPPYAEDPAVSRTDLLERAPRYVRTKPHGRMLLAWQGEEIIGLALGTGIGPGDWWHDRVAPLLDRSVRERWLGEGTFGVAELAVSATHRRTGIAAALMHALLEGLPCSTAVLGVHATADAAHRFYLAQGWLGIASGLRLTPDGAEFTLMGRDLPPAEPPRASAER